MNAVPGDSIGQDVHTEVAREGDKEEGLVEMGTVSETKGGWFGNKPDSGFGADYN
jgi:hypothetical protein